MVWNGSDAIVQLGIYGLQGSQVEYTKTGFERPADGNQAKINVVVSLPCAPGKDELADEYIWSDKIQVLGQALTPDWGSLIVKGRRSIIFTAMGATFAEAFNGAEETVRETLSPLVAAHFNRKTELKVADWLP